MVDDQEVKTEDEKDKKQWVATTGLRWQQTIKGVPDGQGRTIMMPVPILQQAWQEQNTGKFEWRSLPVVGPDGKRLS